MMGDWVAACVRRWTRSVLRSEEVQPSGSRRDQSDQGSQTPHFADRAPRSVSRKTQCWVCIRCSWSLLPTPCRAHKPEKVSLLNTLQEDSRWASFVASREFYLVEVLGLTQQEGPCWACLRGLLEAQWILCIMHPAALTQPRGHPVVPGGGPCGGGGAPLPFLCRAGPLLSPSPLLPPHPEPPSLSLISAVTPYWDSCFPLPTTSPAPSSYNSQWDLFQM